MAFFETEKRSGSNLNGYPPIKQTVSIDVNLKEFGIYEFYCDKSFHSAFGMKGHIKVISP